MYLNVRTSFSSPCVFLFLKKKKKKRIAGTSLIFPNYQSSLLIVNLFLDEVVVFTINTR